MYKRQSPNYTQDAVWLGGKKEKIEPFAEILNINIGFAALSGQLSYLMWS